MPEHDAAEVLRLTGDLHDSVTTILTRLEATKKYARRSRIIGWLGAGMAVIALLVVGVGGYAIYELHQGQLHSCEIGNQLRAGQLQVWDEVLSLSSKPTKPETPAERAARLKQIAQFRVFIGRQFRQVNCTKLYPGILPRNIAR